MNVTTKNTEPYLLKVSEFFIEYVISIMLRILSCVSMIIDCDSFSSDKFSCFSRRLSKYLEAYQSM